MNVAENFDICVGNSVSGQIIMQISVNLDPYVTQWTIRPGNEMQISVNLDHYVTLRLPVETAEKLRILLTEAHLRFFGQEARAGDH